MKQYPDTFLKIHLAGTFSGRGFLYSSNPPSEFTEQQQANWLDYPYLLESYHYIGKNRTALRHAREHGKKLFLDSGAFSMFTQGVNIPLEEYVSFIKKNKDIIEVASVMDGIGDPELTLKNQNELERLGVDVLPCFHYGEDPKYLEHYLKNYDHITLGGMVPISTPDLYKWLDVIWDQYLTDSDGFPTHKVHGFGLTVLDLMKRYPWYSVDSTSWVMTAMFGNIYWPLDSGKEVNLSISSQSPNTRGYNKHYDTLSPTDKLAVQRRVEAAGYTIDGLRDIYWMRDLWNVDYFRNLCDLPIKPFQNQVQGFF